METIDNITLLQWLYASVLFATGLLIGSFLNVVVYRAPLGMSLLSPPSSCPKCGSRIAARDNVPVFGWLLLGGKCRSCRAPISIRYPAVELATGILWAMTGWRLAGVTHGYYADILAGLLELTFVSAMVVTFLVDWDHQIILDEISIGGLVVSLVAAPLLPALHHAESADAFAAHHALLARVLDDAPDWSRSLCAALGGAAVGLAFSLFIYLLGNIAFRKQIEEARKDDPDIDSALGIGDVKLMTCFGAFLGWQAVIFIFLAGSVTGALAGSVLKIRSGDPGGATGLAGLRRRWESGNSVLPFGPFLVVGALVFFFWGWPLIESAGFLVWPEG